MKRTHVKLLLLLILAANAISVSAQQDYLEEYLRMGLDSNLSLKQKQLDYSKNLAALNEAKGLFFPELSLNARYTVAEGGRVIEFPVGDLLNPVYNTLNMLTASNSFPTIENMEFSFYRPREQETKLTVVQPLFSPDLISNYRIKKDLADISGCDISVYKRELIMAITTAYFELRKAQLLHQLADETLLLVGENVRVSRSLFGNDKVTSDVVYRSEAEYAKVETGLASVLGMEKSARAYFNFLLNRPLDAEVLFNDSLEMLMPVTGMEELQEQAVSGREELQLLDYYKTLNGHKLNYERGGNLPGIYGVVNYGFQGETYSFTADDDFVLASVVLQWNIFNGLANRNRIAQVKIDGEILDARISQSENMIRLQVLNAWSAMDAAWQKVESAKKQLVAARKSFYLVERKYREGESPLLEYIDARTNMTNAGTEIIIASTDFYIQKAAFERAAASIDLTNY